VYAYDQSGAFIGHWRNGIYSKQSGASSYYGTEFNIINALNNSVYSIRLCLKKNDGSDITTTESSNVLADNSVIDAIEKTSYQKINYGVWTSGTFSVADGVQTNASYAIRCEKINIDAIKKLLKITVNQGYKFLIFAWDSSNNYIGYWRNGAYSKQSGSGPYYVTEIYVPDVLTDAVNSIRICMQKSDGTDISPSVSDNMYFYFNYLFPEPDDEENTENYTKLYESQKAIAIDWHFPFVDVYNYLGLGHNHIIPNTAKTWSASGTVDLNQRQLWMSDGTHPFLGTGLTEMYGRTIANQIAVVSPSYYNGQGQSSPSFWSGKKLIWYGTSIPAGSDPSAGSGTGATYPKIVVDQLGATLTNKALGSSCVRINSSTGEYTGMIFSHFLRAMSRMIGEADTLANDWSNIYTKITNAPSTLSESNIATMKNHSFETILKPYLDGTYTMPDCFVLDHGHNDCRPCKLNGEEDLLLEPNLYNIQNGFLAEDTYMTANNYANLKLALNSDLSGITNKASFAATLNRNCFRGAMNFIITVILSYNSHARIIIVSDYDTK
jgi:hypothetical protein